jgi:hypothetical protein
MQCRYSNIVLRVATSPDSSHIPEYDEYLKRRQKAYLWYVQFVSCQFSARSQIYEKRLSASSRMSFCPHETLLPLDGFSRNLLFEDFSKIRWEDSSFIKIWQEYRVFYMKTIVHFWSYFVQFFLEWEMFQTTVVDRIKTHFIFNNIFFENLSIYEITWWNVV